ncbi:hypothetical protein JRO89_XS01G0375200 [Xanthoceras sorbifolium]|uniref:MATH domain-containing protein n=1 Tax=Xanthoceras sorbifolium TaxID=99658 RepID=A0ABQ8INV9_9ROSI|nr:hypothetical protein JRO89_XS01G0375200 [Xanthoceras sorbifolium]
MDAHYSVKGAILTGRYTPPTHYVFKIESFSKLTKAIEDKYSSDKFDAEGFSWKLSIYPTGDGRQKWEMSYLYLPRIGHFSRCRYEIVYQVHSTCQRSTDGNRDVEIEDNHMYSPDSILSGRVELLSLAKLQDPKMGFLVDDTVSIEAEVALLGLVMKEQ